MLRTKVYRHGGKGSSFRLPYGWLRRHKGRKLPLSPDPQEMMMRRRMKMMKRGR
jgi:hypothetical protein